MTSRRDMIREFRTALPIRVAALGSLVIWTAVALFAASLDGVPASAFWAIAFFIVFFFVCVTYYFNLAYVVHEYGVTYRGATEFDHFDWDEIMQVDPSDVPLGGYSVTTTRGVFFLNSFVKEHEALAELIIARAGLMPIRY